MFARITFTAAWRCFAAGSRLALRPGVNLIVGDQGVGKSTLLGQLSAWAAFKLDPKQIVDHRSGLARENLAVDVAWAGPPGRFGFFDFERHNPRTQPAIGMGYGYDDALQIAAMFASHGEAVRALGATLDALGTGVLALDEPDMALSVRSLRALAARLADAAARGGQVLATAHNPELIGAVDRVLSLEHDRWMDAAEFLALQRTTPAPTCARGWRREARIDLDG